MQNAMQTLPVIVKASQPLHYSPREKRNWLTYLGQDTLRHLEEKECSFQNLLQYSFLLSGS